MTGHDVPDSTDWLSTPLPGLSSLESALRCQVCKDFYETPMITSCSHTFCSLCIRRALSSDNKCPLCRSSEQEMKLRSNWSMEEAVEAFKKTRLALLEVAQNAAAKSRRSPKRKVDEVDSGRGAQSAPESKRLRSSARLSQNKSQPSYAPEPVEEEVVQVPDSEDEDFAPEPEPAADGLVPCPMCQTRMKEWQVFTHLESCPGEQKPPEPNAITQLGAASRQHNKSLERLPVINYGMLKENALRKKMAELGISNQGPKHLLEKRHKEWVTLWNANCDAARPKKRAELLQDLDNWEKTQGIRAPTSGRAIQNAAIIKDKDFDGTAWAAKHDTSFKDLIANARKSSAQAKKKTDEDESTEPPKEALNGNTTPDNAKGENNQTRGEEMAVRTSGAEVEIAKDELIGSGTLHGQEMDKDEASGIDRSQPYGFVT